MNIIVGVIIPTYNHEKTLADIVISSLRYTSRIIVVIDGADDNSVSSIASLPVIIISFSRNKGKGAALKAGFRKAEELGWHCAVTMDSDGQHLPANIPDFIRSAQQFPQAIIIGNRNMLGPDVPPSSRFGKNFTNFWLKVETGLNIADGQSGFRCYPVAKINKIKCWFNRYEFEVEILARSAWAGIEITDIDIPVEYNPEGGRISHFRPFIDNVRTSLLNTILVLICLPFRLHCALRRKRNE